MHILSLAVIGRYLTTVNQDWDCQVSLGLVYNILEANEEVLPVKLSTVFNISVWVLMTSVLISSVIEIKKLALHFDTTNESLCIALLLLAYEAFAVYLNYLTWSGELWYPLRFLQVIPTLAVVLHNMFEMQFLLAEGWDHKESINPLYFSIFNISLNIAMTMHLGCVAFFIYDYLVTDMSLLSIGIVLTLFKLGFRIIMIRKYWKFYKRHCTLKKPCENKCDVSTGELVLVRSRRVCLLDTCKCCAEYVIPKPVHNDYKLLVTGHMYV